tara:strand:+ start:425 stop:1354 length:930 start_codon:yes stop_codon:yes gene_type:complete
MTILTEVPTYFNTNWRDYTIRDNDLYEIYINVNTVYASDALILIALNLNEYTGYDNTGYGTKTTAPRGITEQESYDNWISLFQSTQRTFKKQLLSLGANKTPVGVASIPQCVYDGLMLYYWVTGTMLNVTAHEGIYDIKSVILNKEWDKLASMIMRSTVYKQYCTRAATILRLADYGRSKSRTWLRTTGIYKMRANNQIGLLNNDELRQARFAYYAETLDFLPLTPDSIKRDIAKKYNETLVVQRFIADGATTTFALSKSVSMNPVEKLQVKVNTNIIQHLFDYTVLGSVLTITKELTAGDLIYTTIKI